MKTDNATRDVTEKRHYVLYLAHWPILVFSENVKKFQISNYQGQNSQ